LGCHCATSCLCWIREKCTPVY